MNTYYITRLGVIDTAIELHKRFAQKYLDYKRDRECEAVYELYKNGNNTLATAHAKELDSIINEQMYITLQ